MFYLECNYSTISMSTGGFRASKLDGGNSSTSTLLASAVFTGDWINVLKYASISIIINSDQEGALQVQQSSDASNVDYVFNSTLTVSAVSSEANGVFTFPVNAQYMRVVYTNGANNQAHFRLQSVIQAVPLIAENSAIIDGNNSTTATLQSSQTFTGTYTDTTKFSEMALIFVKDSTSSGTLYMDLSTDGTIVDRSKSVIYPTGSNGGAHTLVVISRFMRLRYVNDSTAMTTFRLQMVLHPQKSKDLTSTMNQPLNIRNDVQLVRDPTIAEWDLAREFFDGREADFFFGNNDSVSTSFEDIWPDGGDYPFQTTASILDVSSLDAADNGHSTGTLTLAAQPSNGETFRIGDRTYTLQSTLTNQDGNIHISSAPNTAAGTVLNIVAAINDVAGGEGSGTGYAAATTAHGGVTAVDGASDSVDLTSTDAYPLANDGDLEVITTTETGANMSFGDTSTAHPAGCQTIELHGLNATGEDTKELLVMNGTTVVSTTNSFIRINKVHCQTVGTQQGANFDEIQLVRTGGGAKLAGMHGFEGAGTAAYGHGEAGMGMYTIPLGKVGYITQIEINVESNKTCDIALYEAEGCLRTASPFLPRRVIWHASAMAGDHTIDFRSLVKIKQLTDIYFRAVASTGTAKVEVKVHFFIANGTTDGK